MCPKILCWRERQQQHRMRNYFYIQQIGVRIVQNYFAEIILRASGVPVAILS